MIEAKRIRHATFATPDIEAQLEYYQSIIGLGVVARQDGRAYLASESEELTLVLEQDTVAGCKAMAFEVSPYAELHDLGKQAARHRHQIGNPFRQPARDIPGPGFRGCRRAADRVVRTMEIHRARRAGARNR